MSSGPVSDLLDLLRPVAFVAAVVVIAYLVLVALGQEDLVLTAGERLEQVGRWVEGHVVGPALDKADEWAQR